MTASQFIRDDTLYFKTVMHVQNLYETTDWMVARKGVRCHAENCLTVISPHVMPKACCAHDVHKKYLGN